MTVKECSDIRETADLLLYLSKNSMIDTPQIKSLLDDLTDRERRIIELRFGIDGECHTLADCGMKLHLSKERVRQIQKQVLRKIRIRVSRLDHALNGRSYRRENLSYITTKSITGSP